MSKSPLQPGVAAPPFMEGVQVIDDVDDETSSAESSTPCSSPRGPGGPGGTLLRTGSSNAGSRKNSMKPGVGKLPRPVTAGMSTEDVEEAKEELERAQASGSEANLHRLKIGHNPALLSCLREDKFRTLTALILSDNGIASLPHDIFAELRVLRKLDLSENKLSVIPDSALQLPALEILLLDHNGLSEVPRVVDVTEPFFLPSLTVIGLEWNRITQFPCELFKTVAPNLEKVFLCENLGIKALPPLEELLPEERVAPSDGGVKPWRLRMDNRPELMTQYRSNPRYAEYFTMDWNKIYPDNVIPYVYLGSLRTAQCDEVYADLDIGFVLTAGRNLDVYLPDGMTQLVLQLDDVPGEEIATFFEPAIAFIDKAIDAQKGVLIHCFAGLSRSVTVMLAYLMKRRGMTRDAALEKVKETRPNSHPNDGFMQSLLVYEANLKAQAGEANGAAPESAAAAAAIEATAAPS